MLGNANLTTQVLFSRLQSDLDRLQGRFADRVGEVASGKRADLADRLGDSAASLFGLQASLTKAQGHRDRIGVVDTRLNVMQSALQQVRGLTGGLEYQKILDDVANTPTFGALQKQAATEAISRTLSTLNAAVDGRSLFSGLAVDTPPMRLDNAMLSDVETVVATHVAAAGGRIETAAQVDALLAEIGSMFDDTHADPALRFTGQIYQGAPDATEDLSVDDGTGRAITYGAKASEDGIRTLLEGLHLLAAVQKNDGQFGDAAYRRLATATVGMIDTGSNKIVGIEARLGLVQSDTASFRTEQQATAALLETRISALQDADPYEAATKLASLETQLQASYLATSRILRLSLANVL
ncbi:MAG: hypothetical protein KDC18_01725 [Alphaproteobacteria bacterium]|nr:hypothetical protein [Alphaproteobacteria bacterium]MCB9930416.1 hypothetical protein [Alphaproteobacteria bacterium]